MDETNGNANTSGDVITFKSTTSHQQSYTHKYNPDQTVEQIKETIAAHYGVEFEQIKLIFKGKILNNNQTASQVKLANAVVMLVINKKVQKPKKENTDQTIPKIPSSFNTGMGGSSPVGFGGYSLINHPQYMSAISGAVNEQNIEDMMNDPMYASMMEDMMKDPDTIKYLIQENPMLKNMINQNPSMKMILQNPQLMKAVFNPESLKMARQVMKNQGNTTGQGGMPQLGGLGGLGGMGGMGGLGNFGGLGGLGGMQMPSMQMPANMQIPNQQNQNPTGLPNTGFPMGGMGMPGFNPYMMGMYNPFLQGNLNIPNNQVNQNKQLTIEQKYKVQLKELESMGFKDRQQNIKALIESKGDVDGAIEKLCKD